MIRTLPPLCRAIKQWIQTALPPYLRGHPSRRRQSSHHLPMDERGHLPQANRHWCELRCLVGVRRHQVDARPDRKAMTSAGRALTGALPFFVPTRRGKPSRTWDTRYLLYAAGLSTSHRSTRNVLWDMLWKFRIFTLNLSQAESYQCISDHSE